jgi:hypothetical protein
MSKRQDNNKGRLPPFVPLLLDTLKTPAWKATSHGARSLYVALKSRYRSDIHNNGRVYLAQRKAADEIGSKTEQVTRWFRELQHFGFIVMTEPGYLGVDGEGQAPRWRLTEIGYMKDPPTRDFLHWKGEPFVEKKQNPVPEKGTTCPRKGGQERPRKGGHPSPKASPKRGTKGNPGPSPKRGTNLFNHL